MPVYFVGSIPAVAASAAAVHSHIRSASAPAVASIGTRAHSWKTLAAQRQSASKSARISASESQSESPDSQQLRHDAENAEIEPLVRLLPKQTTQQPFKTVNWILRGILAQPRNAYRCPVRCMASTANEGSSAASALSIASTIPSATDRLLRDQTAEHLDRLLSVSNYDDVDFEALWDLVRMLIHMNPSFAFENNIMDRLWSRLLAAIAKPAATIDIYLQSSSPTDNNNTYNSQSRKLVHQRLEKLLLWRLGTPTSSHQTLPMNARTKSRLSPTINSIITPENLAYLVDVSYAKNADDAWSILARLRGQFGIPARHHTVIHAAVFSLALNANIHEAIRLIQMFDEHNRIADEQPDGNHERVGSVNYNYLMQMLCSKWSSMNEQIQSESESFTKQIRWSKIQPEKTLCDILSSLMNAITIFMLQTYTPPDVNTFNYLARVQEIHVFQSAQKFLDQMAAADVMPNARTYCELISDLDLRGAGQLMSEADQRGLGAHADMLYAFLSGCYKRNDVDSGLKMLLIVPRWKELVSSSYLNKTLYFFLEAAASSPIYVGCALEFAHEMHRRNYRPDPEFITTLIQTLTRVGRPEDAAEVALLLSVRDGYNTYLPFRSRTLIVDGMCKKGNVTAAIQFVKDMTSHGIPSMPVAHVMIITALVKYRRFVLAQKWLKSMIVEKQDMRIVIVNLLLEAYIRCRRSSDVDELFSNLPKWGLKPDDRTHHCIIMSMLHRNRLEEAQKYVNDLKKSGTASTDDIDIPFMQFFLSTAQWDRVDQIWKSVLDRAVSKGGSIRNVSDLVLAVYIRGLVMQRKTDEIIRLHNQMLEQERLEWERKHADFARSQQTSVVSTLEQTDTDKPSDFESSTTQEQTFVQDTMATAYVGVGLDPAVHPKTLRSIMSAYLQTGEVERAKKMLENLVNGVTDEDYARMRNVQDLPEDMTEEEVAEAALQASVTRIRQGRLPIRDLSDAISDFIVYFASTGNLPEADLYLEEYLERFINSSRPFVPLIRASVKHYDDLDRAKSYWNMMRSRGINLDERAYSSMLSAHVDAGDIHGAAEVLNELRSRAIVPTERIYNTLIVLYGRAGNVDQMERLYRHMTYRLGSHSRDGVKKEMETINALMTGYSFAGESDKAWAIWERMWCGSQLAKQRKKRMQKQEHSSPQAMYDAFENGKQHGGPGSSDSRKTANTQNKQQKQPVLLGNVFDNDGLEKDTIDSLLFSSSMMEHVKMYQNQRTIQENLYGVTNVTVSLALDVLGFAGRLSRLQAIWKELKEADFPLDENNYISYMEALVRCGEQEQAISVVTKIMPAEMPHVRPSIKMLRNLILLLGPDSTRGLKMQEYVKKNFPDYVQRIKAKLGHKLPEPIRSATKKASKPAAKGSGVQLLNVRTVHADEDQAEQSQVNAGGSTRSQRRRVKNAKLLPPVEDLLAFEEAMLGSTNGSAPRSASQNRNRKSSH